MRHIDLIIKVQGENNLMIPTSKMFVIECGLYDCDQNADLWSSRNNFLDYDQKLILYENFKRNTLFGTMEYI